MTNSIAVFLKFLIFTIYIPKLASYVRADWPETPTWAKTIPYGHEQKTVLQFYFHEIALGNSSTIALIAQAPGESPDNLVAFGNLFMADEHLRVGPDPSSKLIGRAQGISGSASQEGVKVIMGLNYGFVDGIYNGSSIVILALNPILNPVREVPVIGGTGLFRMARGYAILRTYLSNGTSGVVIVGYNVTVFHPTLEKDF